VQECWKVVCLLQQGRDAAEGREMARLRGKLVAYGTHKNALLHTFSITGSYDVRARAKNLSQHTLVVAVSCLFYAR